MIKNAAYWIEKLALQPHPEGGYYRQTYRSDLLLPHESLPREFSGARHASTAIYFLLEIDNFSAFHRLRSDELWHFYLGAPLLIHRIEPDGHYSQIRLGNNPDATEVFQAEVRAGCWFASELAPATSQAQGAAGKTKPTLAARIRERFALVGCTVAPGFDFDDFELAKRHELLQRYPQHRDLIVRLTRS